MENEENVNPQEETKYVPRPVCQVWCARIGLVVFLILLALYFRNIAFGGA